MQVISVLLLHPCSNKVSSLDNVENDQHLYNFKHKPHHNVRYFFCDLECDTVTGSYHKPIIAGVSYRGLRGQELFKQFYGMQCVQDMMTFIIREACNYGRQIQPVICFHNLLYDFSSGAAFLQHITSAIIKNGKMYSVDVMHYGVKTKWIDTYKLISEPLRNFNKMFDLDVAKKEMIPYSFYTIDKVDVDGHYWVDLNEFANEFNKPENGAVGSAAFLEHITGDPEILHRFCRGNSFDALGYYGWYNKYDCITPRKGVEKFNSQLRQFSIETSGVPLKPVEFLSISSFANHYFSMRGCYEGCYENSGGLRNYIQDALYGGRVAGNKELMKKVIEDDWIEDVDFTSLYPYEVASTTGFPVGKCERIKRDDNIWAYAWFIVTIKIHSINKFQQIPMVQRRDDKGKMYWYNKGDEPAGEFIVGIKLTLNSIYGKTCEKRNSKLTAVKSKEKAKQAICAKCLDCLRKQFILVMESIVS